MATLSTVVGTGKAMAFARVAHLGLGAKNALRMKRWMGSILQSVFRDAKLVLPSQTTPARSPCKQNGARAFAWRSSTVHSVRSVSCSCWELRSPSLAQRQARSCRRMVRPRRTTLALATLRPGRRRRPLHRHPHLQDRRRHRHSRRHRRPDHRLRPCRFRRRRRRLHRRHLRPLLRSGHGTRGGIAGGMVMARRSSTSPTELQFPA